MRWEVWDFERGVRLMAFGEREHALTYLRSVLGISPPGRINGLGLGDRGAPGEVATFPLEGAALLAAAFGLEEDDDG